MTPVELLSADDHLARCEVCYGHIHLKEEWNSALASVESAFDGAVAAAAHSDYEHLAAYVDGNLDRAERDEMDAHLQACSECAKELSELRAVQAALTAGSGGRTHSAPISLWPKVVALWNTPAFRTWIPAAGALAALILVAWLVTSPLRDKTEERFGSDRRQGGNVAPKETATTGQSKAEDIAVTLNDGGGRLVMDKQGRLQGPLPLDPSHQDAVKAALIAQSVPPPPVLRELTTESERLMGSEHDRTQFRLIGPVSTVVLDDRPTFSWHPLTGAQGYDVAIYDANHRAVASGRSLATTIWRAPQPLYRGRIYTWQVRAEINGREVLAPPPTAPEARFKVLDEARAEQLKSLQQAYGASHMMLGVIYAEAGLMEESEREFQALLKANPHSAVAVNLLRSVRTMRP